MNELGNFTSLPVVLKYLIPKLFLQSKFESKSATLFEQQIGQKFSNAQSLLLELHMQSEAYKQHFDVTADGVWSRSSQNVFFFLLLQLHV